MTPVLEKKERRFLRVNIVGEAQYQSALAVVRARVVDISEGGFRLAGSPFLPVRSALRVYLSLPAPREGRVRMTAVDAEVIWRNSAGVGLHFLGLPEGTAADIRLLVTRCLKPTETARAPSPH
jgi:hypothetical protein